MVWIVTCIIFIFSFFTCFLIKWKWALICLFSGIRFFVNSIVNLLSIHISVASSCYKLNLHNLLVKLYHTHIKTLLHILPHMLTKLRLAASLRAMWMLYFSCRTRISLNFFSHFHINTNHYYIILSTGIHCFFSRVVRVILFLECIEKLF